MDGTATLEHRARPALSLRHPYAALVLLCVVLWLPGFFSIPPSDRDESRFVQASKQMLETGDFVQIRNGEEERNRKPIGIYWLQAPFAAAAQAAGLARENPVWPYRIPSALGGLLAVLATFALWRGMLGEEVALLASAMLAGSVILVVETHLATTDAALLGVTTVRHGLLARAYLAGPRLSRAQAALFWLAIGAGILIKGPVTPMVAGLTALALVAVGDQGRGGRAAWLQSLRSAWGVPLMLAVVLPWFVAIGVATHGSFFAEAIGGDLAGKLRGGDNSHGAPPGVHFLLLPVLLFPASLFALRALPEAWKARREPVTRFLLAWIIPSWAVFELVPTKLPHYTLPLYPALCLLAARWTLDLRRDDGPRWFVRLAGITLVIAAGIVGLGAAALPVFIRPELALDGSARPPRTRGGGGDRMARAACPAHRGLAPCGVDRAPHRAAPVLGDLGDRTSQPSLALDRAPRGRGARRTLARRPASGRGVRSGRISRAQPHVPVRDGHTLARHRRGRCPVSGRDPGRGSRDRGSRSDRI